MKENILEILDNLKEVLLFLLQIFIFIIVSMIILGIFLFILSIFIKLPDSEKECTDKGGIYVREMTYGSKCHFIGERNEE